MKKFLIMLIPVLCISAKAELVAHYQFEGNLDDALGNYPGQAVNTIAYGSSNYGGDGGSQCLQLTSHGAPGGDDGVVIPGSESLLDGPTALTVSVWYKAETPTAFPYWDCMVSKIGVSGTQGDGVGWAAGRFGGTTGHMCFFYRNGGYYAVATGQPVTDGQWHHIVCTYASASVYGVDGNARGKLYIDGQLVANRYQDAQEAILSSSSNPITIGVTIFNSVYKDSIYGYLDDVRLYDNFMTDSEIYDLYVDTSAAPIVTSQPENALADVGDNVTFDVEVLNASDYSWYKSSDPNLVPAGDAAIASGAATLLLSNVQIADEGYYYCVIDSGHVTVTSNAAVLMTRRMVSRWNYENDLNDSVSGYNGTRVSTAVYDSENKIIDSYALQYDLVNDEVTVPYQMSLNGVNFSVAFWANVISGNDGITRVAVCNRDTGPNAGFNVYIRGYDNWAFSVGSGSGTSLIDGPEVVTNQWTYVVASFEQTGVSEDEVLGTIKLYVNGVQAAADTNVPYAFDTRNAEFIMGSDWNTSSGFFNPFKGLLDDVCYYSYPLSATEIAQIYADTTGHTVCVNRPDRDYTDDCIVDLSDFAVFVGSWLTDGNIYPSGM